MDQKARRLQAVNLERLLERMKTALMEENGNLEKLNQAFAELLRENPDMEARYAAFLTEHPAEVVEKMQEELKQEQDRQTLEEEIAREQEERKKVSHSR